MTDVAAEKAEKDGLRIRKPEEGIETAIVRTSSVEELRSQNQKTRRRD